MTEATTRRPSPAEILSRAGRLLHRRSQAPPGLPPLLFFTDPQRTPDPLAVVRTLPRGSGIVFRAFGAPDRLHQARRLARACGRRGVLLLVGAEPWLARRAGADGLHLPERAAVHHRAPHALVTWAAHGAEALRRARRLGADAAVLSPVFPSRSPSAKAPLGLRRAAALAGASPLPVYALGGVRPGRIPRGRFCGVAAVEALAAMELRT